MIVMPQYLYKFCTVLLVYFLSIYSIELSFITSVFVMLLSVSSKINYNLLIAVMLISLMTLTGILSSYKLEFSTYDTIKDLVYFLRPITILLASYFVVKKLNSVNYVFNAVILIAMFFAIKHLFNIIIHMKSIDSYIYLRALGGKQNHIEIVALIFLFFTPFTNGIINKYRKLIIITILTSFVLYLSRTMIIILIIFYLGYKEYLFLNSKIIKRIFVIAIMSILIGFTISRIETDRNSTGLKAFIYKTQNSFSELFQSVESEEGIKDQRLLWEHWRAYEARKAIEQLGENGLKSWIIGTGFGSQINLKTEVSLDGKKVSKVPSIHNGFVNVMFKTGIIGLFFYVSFIAYIFVSNQRNKKEEYTFLINKLLVSTSLYMLYNSFVITGFFRSGEFSIFLFGILIATRHKIQKSHIIG